MKTSGRVSFLAWLFCSILILIFAFLRPRWNEVTNGGGAISWDVAGYYLYLPAFIIYNDAKELKFIDEIENKYHIPGIRDAAFKEEKSGNMVMKYSAGMAVMYFPFFLLGHLLALIGNWPVDGFSFPYQLTLSFGSMLIAFLGLWVLRKVLLRFFDNTITAITLLLIVIGTNYFNYASFDYAMAHNYLFTICAILLLATIKFYENPTFSKAAIIGVGVGLAALTRPTVIVFAIIPLLWNWTTFREKFLFLKINLSKILLAALICAVIGSLQLIYWKWATGNWLVYSYEDQGFSWKSPHFHAVWFSYRKGWFLYTPMMIFAIIGLFFLFSKRLRPHVWMMLVLFFVHMWIVAAWDIWWYGGGFGQRAMIDIYPILAFPIAALAAAIWRFPLLKIALAPVVGFFILLNIFQSSWQPMFETEAMTRAYYWRIFGKLNPQPRDRYLLDTDEDFAGTPANVQSVFKEDWENCPDTTALRADFSKSGKYSTWVDGQKEFSATTEIDGAKIFQKGTWLRARAQFFTLSKEWQDWWMPQFVVKFERGDQTVKIRFIRPHRELSENQWLETHFDTRVPEEPFDKVKIYLWNANGYKPLVMDDLVVELFD